MPAWAEFVFGADHALSWGQECTRAALVFTYGLFLLRLGGRRVFGRWSALDIVVSIIVGSSLSRALTGAAPLFGTLAASTLMVGLHAALARAAAASPRIARLVEGGSVVLARDGRAVQAAMRRHGVSEADLAEALHQAKVADVAQTRLVLLEPSGTISVRKR